MEKNILKLFVERGFLLDADMLRFLNSLEDEKVAHEILQKVALSSHQKVITKQLVSQHFEKIKPVFSYLTHEKKKLVDNFFVNVSVSVSVHRTSEVIIEKQTLPMSSVKVLSSPVLHSQKLTVRDFVKNFRHRYTFLKELLQQKSELAHLTSIDKIAGNAQFSIIGIISEKRVTKNKNIFLTVEDLTGSARLLITQQKEEIFEKSKELLLDDVVGFVCSGTRDFIFVNDIIYPDAHLPERRRIEEDAYALFISDIHVGSNNFLHKNFERFLDWLQGVNCTPEQQQLLKKIKYLFVVGDTVEGVGIYPGQEKELVIKDVSEQYRQLALYYQRIPKHITIIQCAGQHDAVRVAEPQPPVGDDFAPDLHALENMVLVSNPAMVEIGATPITPGLKVLMYHGASMHPVINSIEELRLHNGHRTPAKVMKHLLLRRHLAPIHGEHVYIPHAKEDPLLIKEVPDVVTTGDLHRTDIDTYNGILIICNSCWQSMTAFEEKVGNEPDPCKVPVLNLRTREVKILDFSDVDEGDNSVTGGDDES